MDFRKHTAAQGNGQTAAVSGSPAGPGHVHMMRSHVTLPGDARSCCLTWGKSVLMSWP